MLAVSGEEADDVQNLVEETLSANEHLQQLIDESTWIIFAMLNVDAERSPGSQVVHEFLRQEGDQLGNKQVIVLSLNAPYFLDATDISRLTAYIGVYSKIQPFIESAIHVLFRSYPPIGAPAVSVPGTRFRSLSERLQADPDTTLSLTIEVNGTVVEEIPDNTPILNVSSLIRLQIDQIVDQNGHLVPDGTPVQFELAYENPELTLAVPPVMTRNGSATTEVLLTQPGRLLVSASVGEATTAEVRVLNIQDPAAEATADSATITAAPSNDNTNPLTTTVIPDTTQAPSPENDNGADGPTELEPPTGTSQTSLRMFLVAMLTIAVTLSILAVMQIHLIPRTILVKNMLWAMIFGLSAYIFFALGILPGTQYLIVTFRHWSAAIVVFVAMLLPLLWLQLGAEEMSPTA